MESVQDYSQYYNSTSAYDDSSEDDICGIKAAIKFESDVVPVVFTILALLGLIGNVLVLLILGIYENLKSLTNFLLLNRTLSDLMFTLGLPFWASSYIWGWTLGDFMCKAMTFVLSAGFYSSTMFLMLMTLWSHVAAVHDLSDCNRWRSLVVASILAWLFSFAAALPDMLHSEVTIRFIDSERHSCEYSSIAAFIGINNRLNVFFVVTVLVMAFYCIRIQIQTNHRNWTIKLTFCMVLVFFVSWAPFNIAKFLSTLMLNWTGIFTGCNAVAHLYYAYIVCRLIAFSHCCLNPMLYVLVGVKSREHLRTLLRKIFRC